MNILNSNANFSETHKIILLVLVSVIVTLINLYCCITNFAIIIAMQLYYLPITLMALFCPKKGLLISFGLIVSSVLFSFIFQENPVIYKESLIIAIIMAGIAIILSFTSSEVKKNQLEFKALFQSIPNPIITLDNSGNILEINNEFEKDFGYTRDFLLGKKLAKTGIFSEDSHQAIKENFEKFKSGKQIKSFLTGVRIYNSPDTIRKNLITFIGYEKTECPEFTDIKMVVFSDITEQTEITEKLKQSEKKYRRLADHLPQTIAELDREMNITFINKKGLKIFGFTDEDIIRGINIPDYIAPENCIKAKEIMQKIIAGEIDESSSEFTAVRKDKTRFPIRIYSNQIKEKGKIIGVRLVIADLTKLKETETALNQTEEKLSKLMENFSGMVYKCKFDNNLTTEFLSEGFFELTEYSHSDIIKEKTIDLKSIIHPEDFEKFKCTIYESIENSGHFETRFRILTSKGEERWVWNQGTVLKNKNDPGWKIEGLASNITELVKTEEALKQTEQKNRQYILDSLKEKEILLKEIHHRVKNNLQIIASILKLSDMQSESTKMHEVLLDCRSRVFSMAMIHEKLYKSENLAKINFKDYISTLQMHLADEYGGYEKNIKMICECDENIALDIDTAIPCGLVVNEILTNALKYAFDESGGSIKIQFYETPDDNYSLVVKDNGKGFPKSYDYEHSDSLGMQLIYNLIIQLEGKIEIKTGPGTEYIITIPKKIQGSVKL